MQSVLMRPTVVPQSTQRTAFFKTADARRPCECSWKTLQGSRFRRRGQGCLCYRDHG